MSKKQLFFLLLGSFFFIGILWMVNFLFNPLGLGPEAKTVLPDQFFKNPVNNLGELELLIDGQEAFDSILKAISSAKSSIYIQTFIWKDDRIGQMVAAELKAAVKRGVKVIVSKDALGTFFELGDTLHGKPSPVFTQSGLKNTSNIETRVNLFSERDHSKYFIIDKQVVVLGGMNIADEYYLDWHDYMAVIRSSRWTQAFEKKVLDGMPWPEEAPFFIAVNDNQTVEIRTALIEIIDQARQSIVIEHAYFSTQKIIDAIERAVQRGVNVRIILPRVPDTHLYANQVTINKLLQSDRKDSPKVFLFPQMMHAKVVLADGNIAAVGSANLTLRSMLTIKEVTLFVHGRPNHPFIHKLQKQLESDIAKSELVQKSFVMNFSDRMKAKIGKYVW